MATVRTELPRDLDAVRVLLSLSFRREAEARLVDRLRAAGKLSVALVAEDKERILGHIVFSKNVVSVEGVPANLLVLAPIAVMPAFQRLGIGSERELLKWYLAMWGSFQRDDYQGAASTPLARAPSDIPR